MSLLTNKDRLTGDLDGSAKFQEFTDAIIEWHLKPQLNLFII